MVAMLTLLKNPLLRSSIKKGFALIELLIVVAIISVLVTIGVPMYQGYIAQAQETKLAETCSNVRADIESATLYCKLYPDKTLPILPTTQKTPCSWGANSIALYMYQKWTAIAKTISHPEGWGDISVVGFNKSGTPFRGGAGLLANGYPVAIKYVNSNQDYKYVELTCNDFYNPPHEVTVYNFEREYTN
jgi:prepilin-type N-terminal cleavage/methylation domain-containing protein